MKLNNCPSCNAKEDKLHIHDCGYNTFNAGHVECKSCGLKIDFNCMEEEEDYIRAWNNLTDTINNVTKLSKTKLKKLFVTISKLHPSIFRDVERENEVKTICKKCAGNGKIFVLQGSSKREKTCPDCNGKGLVNE